MWEARLYIDRLAHWRCSLVDPQLEIQALAAVPKAFLNYTSRESRNLSFNLGWMNKKLLCHDGIRTQDPRIMEPMSYHWATAFFLIMGWYFVYIYITISTITSVRPSIWCSMFGVRCASQNFFFCLNRLEMTPWLLGSTPGVDPGYPRGMQPLRRS